MPSRDELQTAAVEFCNARQGENLDYFMSLFSTKHPIKMTIHGEPALGPFIGRAFSGEGIRFYFTQAKAKDTLTHGTIMYSDLAVDDSTNRVAMKAQSRFTWVPTNESWRQTSAYIIDFDDEVKVTHYQIWGDTGAAYLAQIGKLQEMRESVPED